MIVGGRTPTLTAPPVTPKEGAFSARRAYPSPDPDLAVLKAALACSYQGGVHLCAPSRKRA